MKWIDTFVFGFSPWFLSINQDHTLRVSFLYEHQALTFASFNFNYQLDYYKCEKVAHKVCDM